MDITSLLSREAIVAGLEISDTHVRLCFFKQDKKTKLTKLHIQGEQPLPAHAIINGIIQDTKAVTKALTTLFNPLSGNINYVIVAIPSQCCYVKLFTFPKAIQGKKLEETMNLTIGFQLPLHTEDIYLDWDATEDRSANEVVLAAAKKSTIEAYMSVLTAAKLNPVAIEPQVLAILRSINIPADDHTLIVDETSTNDILFWVAHKGDVQFIRSLPKELSEQKAEDLRKIIAFYEAEHGATPTVVHLDHAAVRPDIETESKTPATGIWLASIGAAQRGNTPRAQDSLISLMPIGTSEAYKRQRMLSFVEFIANATVGIALFFSAAFTGTWMLMSLLQQRTLVQLENIAAIPNASDTGELEARAKTLNTLTNAAHQVLQKTPQWSHVIEELRKRSPQGIIITNTTLPSPEGAMLITGTAADRGQLTAFKKSVEESALFTEISLPATNLELRAAIPFSLSFKLKDPTALYIQ